MPVTEGGIAVIVKRDWAIVNGEYKTTTLYSFDGGDTFNPEDEEARRAKESLERNWTVLNCRAWPRHKWEPSRAPAASAASARVGPIRCARCGLCIAFTCDASGYFFRERLLYDPKRCGSCRIPMINHPWFVGGETSAVTAIDYWNEMFRVGSDTWFRLGEGRPFDPVAAIWSHSYRSWKRIDDSVTARIGYYAYLEG